MAHFIWAVPDNNNIYNFPDRKIPIKIKTSTDLESCFWGEWFLEASGDYRNNKQYWSGKKYPQVLLHSECSAGKTTTITTISTFSQFQFQFIYLPEKKYTKVEELEVFFWRGSSNWNHGGLLHQLPPLSKAASWSNQWLGSLGWAGWLGKSSGPDAFFHFKIF